MASNPDREDFLIFFTQGLLWPDILTPRLNKHQFRLITHGFINDTASAGPLTTGPLTARPRQTDLLSTRTPI